MDGDDYGLALHAHAGGVMDGEQWHSHYQTLVGPTTGGHCHRA